MQKEFEEFIAAFNKHFSKRYRPTGGLLIKFKKRRETFTLDEMYEALSNLAHSPHHKGYNDRGWVASPEFLLRNDEQVDRFLNTTPVVQVKDARQFTWKLANKHGVQPDEVRKITEQLLSQGFVSFEQLEEEVVSRKEKGEVETITIV